MIEPRITVDDTRALLRFGRSGIPERVRTNLRRLLPRLGKTVGDRVEGLLNSELKSRRSLTVSKLMHDDPTGVFVEIGVVSSANPLLPRWLELGTRPHGPVTAPFLVFQIDGEWVRTKWVVGVGQRQGYTMGYHFIRTAVQASRGEIDSVLQQAREGLNG